jgi:hypothetical protein
LKAFGEEIENGRTEITGTGDYWRVKFDIGMWGIRRGNYDNKYAEAYADTGVIYVPFDGIEDGQTGEDASDYRDGRK